MTEPESSRSPNQPASTPDSNPPESFTLFVGLKARFNLGQTVITSNAQSVLPPDEVSRALWRHGQGDWGDVCDEDAQTNERGVKDQGMILSSYQSAKGVKFWVITDPGHEVTTVLLPDDY